MKKSVFIPVIVLLLSSCTGLPFEIPFLGTPTPGQADQQSQFTATPFSLDPTSTPNLFVLNTSQPTSTPSTGTPLVTDTPLPTSTPTIRATITLEPMDPMLFTPSPNLFLMVRRST
ncbi:MAG: hypothetical protein WCC12_18520, partial [Anaerolineales bacterium]